jgi:hypothetical protein
MEKQEAPKWKKNRWETNPKEPMTNSQSAKMWILAGIYRVIEDEIYAHGPRNPEPRKGTAEQCQEERDQLSRLSDQAIPK